MPLAVLCAPTAAQTRWGAVAVAPDGNFASAVDLPTRAGAIDAALAQCGPKCERSFAFSNGCGAYVEGQAAFGWANAETREETIANAMGECRKRTTGCRLRVWLCTAR